MFLCCVMICYATLRCILCYVVLRNVVLCYAVLYHVMPCYAHGMLCCVNIMLMLMLMWMWMGMWMWMWVWRLMLMLCYALCMLCYVMLILAMLYYVMLCYAMIMLRYMMTGHAMSRHCLCIHHSWRVTIGHHPHWPWCMSSCNFEICYVGVCFHGPWRPVEWTNFLVWATFSSHGCGPTDSMDHGWFCVLCNGFCIHQRSCLDLP